MPKKGEYFGMFSALNETENEVFSNMYQYQLKLVRHQRLVAVLSLGASCRVSSH